MSNNQNLYIHEQQCDRQTGPPYKAPRKHQLQGNAEKYEKAEPSENAEYKMIGGIRKVDKGGGGEFRTILLQQASSLYGSLLMLNRIGLVPLHIGFH